MPDFTRIVQDAYLEVLERAADPGGLAHYNALMNQGLSEADLREALLRSAEYAARNPNPVGPLRIHPLNPRYFEDASSGQAVQIASYSNIVPTSAVTDYAAQVEEARRNRISYCRMWTFLPFEGTDAIWPWLRGRRGTAYMGGFDGRKFNLNNFNQEFYARVSDACGRALSAGIFTQIHVFDRVGMSPADDLRWGNNPWAADNNLNDLEVPDARPPNDGTPDFYFYATKPNLRAQQERYVRKMIDETIRHPNVHYEVENEHWEHDDPDWANHYGRFIKDHIAAAHPTATPRLVSYNSLAGDLESLFGSTSIDVINKHFGGEAEADPDLLNRYLEPRWPRGKPINVDEFANGVSDTNLLRRMCWTILSSGGHFHIEDALPASRPFEVVEVIRRFKEDSGWAFVRAAPNRGLVTSGGGYCLAEAGREYVCYFPPGGARTVTVSAGEYREQWWNPRAGGFTNAATFTHGGGDRAFNPPDGNDWVLHVRSVGGM
jgi:hypothetical protein